MKDCASAKGKRASLIKRMRLRVKNRLKKKRNDTTPGNIQDGVADIYIKTVDQKPKTLHSKALLLPTISILSRAVSDGGAGVSRGKGGNA